jgi:hypothetical protein
MAQQRRDEIYIHRLPRARLSDGAWLAGAVQGHLNVPEG